MSARVCHADVIITGSGAAAQMLAVALGHQGHSVIVLAAQASADAAEAILVDTEMRRVLQAGGWFEGGAARGTPARRRLHERPTPAGAAPSDADDIELATQCALTTALRESIAACRMVIQRGDMMLSCEENENGVSLTVLCTTSGEISPLHGKYLVDTSAAVMSATHCIQQERSVAGGDAGSRVLPAQPMCFDVLDAVALAWRLDLVLTGLAHPALLRDQEPQRGHAAGARAGMGNLVPQAQIRSGRRTSPLDQLVGGRFAVIARSNAVLGGLSMRSKSFFESLGARLLYLRQSSGCPEGAIEETGSEILRYLDDRQLCAILVRPDLYIHAGAVTPDELEDMVQGLAHTLGYEERPKNTALIKKQAARHKTQLEKH